MSDAPLTVTFLRGLSASGKSTIARALAIETGAIRLNLDDLRSQFSLPWSKEHERFVQGQQDAMTLAALRSGRSVIWDNTNLIERNPRRIATLIWEGGTRPEYQLIHVDVSEAECVARNLERAALDAPDPRSAPVPASVIRQQAKLWAKEVDRGPWTIESIHRGLPEIVPVGWDPLLPTACLVDMDGTLCDSAGKRGPYDFDKCADDEPHHEVIDFVNLWESENSPIFVCTGRDEKYRQMCRDWLNEHGVHFDGLLMRPEGDRRRDSVVKLELFNDHIRGRYNVAVAWDDRFRVCQTWHNLGITVFRCGDPSADF
jgi:predicted kinase